MINKHTFRACSAYGFEMHAPHSRSNRKELRNLLISKAFNWPPPARAHCRTAGLRRRSNQPGSWFPRVRLLGRWVVAILFIGSGNVSGAQSFNTRSRCSGAILLGGRYIMKRAQVESRTGPCTAYLRWQPRVPCSPRQSHWPARVNTIIL